MQEIDFEKDLNGLSIKSIRINYIYSFFLGTYKKSQVGSNTYKNDKVILNWDSPIDGKNVTLKDIFINHFIGENIKDGTSIITEYHESEEKEPLSNRSALYFKFPHLSIKKEYQNKVKIKNLFEKEKNGELSIHIALFQTGMGIMWVSIEINDINGLSDKEVKEICFINQRKKMPEIEKFYGPHIYFAKEVAELKNNLNKVLESQSVGYKFNNNQELDFFWNDDKNNYSRGKKIFQEPSIAILLKSDNYLDYIEKNAFQHYISSILHGTSIFETDKNHHINDGYTNLYSNKEFFTTLHDNCLLVIHKQEYENKTDDIEDYNLFKEYTYGLFRTYCAVRGTWYVYNLLSEEIDQRLNELNIKIDNGNGINRIKESEDTKNYIVLKSHFIQFLNSEDPFVRGIGLTKFAKIYEEVIEIYKADEIKNNIKYKLDEYGKIIDAINSYKFYNVGEKKVTIIKRIMLLPILTFSVLGLLSVLKFYCKINVSNYLYVFMVIVSFFVLAFWAIINIIKRK
jgi:hypothetical protein